MWDSLVRRKAFLYFSSLPPLHRPLPPSLFPPHFVSRVLKSQCKYILRGIYNSGIGGGSGSPVSAAGWRRLGLGWACLLRLKGKNAKRCGMRTSNSSIDLFLFFFAHLNWAWTVFQKRIAHLQSLIILYYLPHYAAQWVQLFSESSWAAMEATH